MRHRRPFVQAALLLLFAQSASGQDGQLQKAGVANGRVSSDTAIVDGGDSTLLKNAETVNEDIQPADVNVDGQNADTSTANVKGNEATTAPKGGTTTVAPAKGTSTRADTTPGSSTRDPKGSKTTQKSGDSQDSTEAASTDGETQASAETTEYKGASSTEPPGTTEAPEPAVFHVWSQASVSSTTASQGFSLKKLNDLNDLASSDGVTFRLLRVGNEPSLANWTVRLAEGEVLQDFQEGLEVSNASRVKLNWADRPGVAHLVLEQERAGRRHRLYHLLRPILPPTAENSAKHLRARLTQGIRTAKELESWTTLSVLVTVEVDQAYLARLDSAQISDEVSSMTDENVQEMIQMTRERLSDRPIPEAMGVYITPSSGSSGGRLEFRKTANSEATLIEDSGAALSLLAQIRFSPSQGQERQELLFSPIMLSKSGNKGPAAAQILTVDPSRWTTAAPAEASTTGEPAEAGTTTEAPLDCAGVAGGGATLNRCGFCNDSESCVDCAGRPYGSRLRDACGACKEPDAADFDEGCGAKVAWVRPDVFAANHPANLSFRIAGRKADFVPSCSLGQGLRTSNVRERKVGKVYTAQLASTGGGGTARLSCEGVKDPSPPLRVLDLTTARPVTLSPPRLSRASAKRELTFAFSAPIGQVVEKPFCVRPGHVTPRHRFPARLGADGESLVCDVSALAKVGEHTLLPVLHKDLLQPILAQYSPMRFTLEARPGGINHLRFSNSLRSLQLRYDRAVKQGSVEDDCSTLVTADSLSSLGKAPQCSVNGRIVVVQLGEGHTLDAGSKIQLKDLSDRKDQTLSGGTSPAIRVPQKAVVPAFELVSTAELSSCDESFEIAPKRLRGTGQRPLSFTFRLVSHNGASDAGKAAALEAALSSSSSAPLALEKSKHLVPASEYVFGVVACNFAAKCSSERRLRLSVTKAEASLAVRILGASEGQEVGLRDDLKLTVEHSLQHCPGKVVTDDKASASLSLESDELTARAGVYTVSLDKLGGRLGEAVTLEASGASSATGLVAEASLRLRLVPLPPVLRLGPSHRTLPPLTDLVLDASSSTNPNGAANPIMFTWSCTADGRPCQFLNETKTEAEATQLISLEELKPAFSDPILRIRSGALLTGTQLRFSVVGESAGLSDSAEVAIDVPGLDLSFDGVPGAQPPLLLPLPLRPNERPSARDWISLRARVGAQESLAVSVLLSESESGDEVILPDAFRALQKRIVEEKYLSGDNFVFAFSIPPADEKAAWAGLAPDTEYRVSIMAEGSQRMSTAAFSFRTNGPPEKGELVLRPDPATVQLKFGDALVAEAGDGWEDAEEPLSFQWGLRAKLPAAARTEPLVRWYPKASWSRRELYLSPAMPKLKCGREGWSLLLRVCDALEDCSEVESAPFTVLALSAAEEAAAVERLGALAAEEGGAFGGVQKAETLGQTECSGPPSAATQSLSSDVASSVLSAVSSESSESELVAALEQSTALVSAIPKDKAAEVAEQLRRVMRLLAMPAPRRTKRATGLVEDISLATAGALLKSVDALLILAGAEGGADYLGYMDRILESFCRQRDASQPSLPAFSASQPPITNVQAQVVRVTSSLLRLDMARYASRAALVPSTGTTDALRVTYDLWKCDGGQGTCSELCLASASISPAAEVQSALEGLLFASEEELGPGMLASELVAVEWRDPVSGARAPGMTGSRATAALRLPLLNATDSAVLQCYVRTLEGHWERCGDGELAAAAAHYDCACQAPGIVGAFRQLGPLLPNIRPFRAVQLTLRLHHHPAGTSSNAMDPSQAKTLVTEVAAAAGVERSRLVEEALEEAELSMTVRPGPDDPLAMDVAEAVRAINRSLAVGLWLSDRRLKADQHSLNATPIRRRVVLDLQGRVIRFTALTGALGELKLEPEPPEVGLWKSALSESLFFPEQLISVLGIEANGTGAEVSVLLARSRTVHGGLSPEEAALLFAERLRFRELSLAMADGTELSLVASSAQIDIHLRERDEESNLLPIVVGSAVGGLFVVVIVLVCVLVFFKQKGRDEKISPSSSPSLHSPPGSAPNTSTLTALRRLSIDHAYR